MKIIRFTHKNIRPYGRIIDSGFLKDGGSGDKFGVLLRERSRGWRIGYLVLRKRKVERLESHPDSLETFEPVKGRAVIFLAADRDPGNMKAFWLDRPVVINKGVWHGLAAVSKRCEIKIFENIEVKTAFHFLLPYLHT